MIIRQYQYTDALSILKRKAKQPCMKLDSFTEQLAISMENFPAMTAVHNGEILCCGGVEIPYAGLGNVWFLMADDVTENVISLAKATKRQFNKWIVEYDLKRVQAFVDVNFKAGIRFAGWMGMSQEARLKKHLPGGVDSYVYSKVGD